jgi:hypothetical protein
MKTATIIVLALVTGCTYAPKDDHSTHYHTSDKLGKKTEEKPKKMTDEDYVQQYIQRDKPPENEIQNYGNTPEPRVINIVRPNPYENPYYTNTPHPVNRTVYYVETRY